MNNFVTALLIIGSLIMYEGIRGAFHGDWEKKYYALEDNYRKLNNLYENEAILALYLHQLVNEQCDTQVKKEADNAVSNKEGFRAKALEDC